MVLSSSSSSVDHCTISTGSFETEVFPSDSVYSIMDHTAANVMSEGYAEDLIFVRDVSLDDLLLSESCPVVDFIIAQFNQRFGTSHTKRSFMNDPEAKMRLCYYGYMRFMAGKIRLDDTSNDNRRYAGKHLYRIFKEAKDEYRKKIDTASEDGFMDRMMPLIRTQIPSLDENDEKKLKDMYELIKEKFAGIYRTSERYDGQKVTYVTHLKEAFLTQLFFGDEISVDSLLEVLGHDLIEDTDVTKEDIKEQFGPEVAFVIYQLSKWSVPKMLNRMIEAYPDYDTGNIPNRDFDYIDPNFKNGILSYYKAYQEKKRQIISDIPPELKQYKEAYQEVKEAISKEYFDRMYALAKHDTVYFDPVTLEPIDTDELNQMPYEYCSVQVRDIIAGKSSDVINNEGSLHGSTDAKILRKTKEAKKSVLPLAQKHCSEYVPILIYRIRYWEKYLKGN